MENEKELLQLKLENTRLKIRLIQTNIAMMSRDLTDLQHQEKELEGQLVALTPAQEEPSDPEVLP